MTWFDTKYPNIGEEIEEKKVLSDELIDQIVLIAEEFKRAGDNMANIREIQSRINSVKDTMKITNAMYMISSSKMTHAKKNLRIQSLTFMACKAKYREYSDICRTCIMDIFRRARMFQKESARSVRSLLRRIKDWQGRIIIIS